MQNIGCFYNFGFLKNEQESTLLEKIKAGDVGAKDLLIRLYMRMVISIARKFCKSYVTSLEDLIQEGALAILSAAENFNPSFNIKFSSYVKIWIKEIIKRRFCKDVYMVHTPFRVVKKSFGISKDGFMGKEVKKGENNAILNIIKKPMYIDDNSKKNGKIDFELEADNIYYYPHLSLENKEVISLLKNCVKELDNREKIIIEQRFFSTSKPTYIEIGKLLSVSPETVRNIEKRAIQKIKIKMKKKGFRI